ncbi:MAG: hypothetical protein IJU41_02310, partial [Clostridia bacterium]|nr:hypothetical protein [Clostridia bacterium]
LCLVRVSLSSCCSIFNDRRRRPAPSSLFVRRLSYLTTPVLLCQEIFLTFFKVFIGRRDTSTHARIGGILFFSSLAFLEYQIFLRPPSPKISKIPLDEGAAQFYRSIFSLRQSISAQRIFLILSSALLPNGRKKAR